MALTELHSLLLIFTIAMVAPILCEWVPWVRLPLVVAEISLGILVEPQVLGWAAAGPTIQVLANFGAGFSLFPRRF
jgi:Kef-type K+ transport system membrane component KefB